MIFPVNVSISISPVDVILSNVAVSEFKLICASALFSPKAALMEIFPVPELTVKPLFWL